MIFEFSDYKLDIDIEKTRGFYENEIITDFCSCPDCRNFHKLIEKPWDFIPAEVLKLFDSLGADIKKPAEVYVFCGTKDNLVHYGGIYHLCGKLLNESLPKPEHEKSIIKRIGFLRRFLKSSPKPIPAFFHKAADWEICFSEGGGVIEEGFPTPIIQMDIFAKLPWVLDEKNVYCV